MALTAAMMWSASSAGARTVMRSMARIVADRVSKPLGMSSVPIGLDGAIMHDPC